MATRKELNTIIVDGVEFLWCIERNPQWCTVDGWKGPVLHVQSASGGERYLNIELPFELKKKQLVVHHTAAELKCCMD